VGEVDGLVHISAVGTSRVLSVTDVANVDDEVQVCLKSVDGTKVSLTMLSVLEDEADKAESFGRGGRDSSRVVLLQEPPTSSGRNPSSKSADPPSLFSNGPIVDDMAKQKTCQLPEASNLCRCELEKTKTQQAHLDIFEEMKANKERRIIEQKKGKGEEAQRGCGCHGGPR
jgi:hypothetical protein